ncbi:hypothetical protein RDABS01_009025 [Bienertia sinuspersici]
MKNLGMPSTTQWSPPPNGWNKVNVDAHVLEGSKTALGVAIRDSNGEIKAIGARNICPTYTEHAEAEAARFGVLLVRRLGISKIVLEMDALNVAQAIKIEVKRSTPIFLIYEDIKLYKQMFEEFSCNHVKRSGNAVAHLIARLNCDDCNEYVRVCSFSQSILTLADLDVNQIPIFPFKKKYDC